MITPEPAACSRRCGRSGRLKNRRKNGSRKSGLSSIGARVTTEMFTTAGVTCWTTGASVGRPRASIGTAAAPRAGPAVSAINNRRVRMAPPLLEDPEEVVVIVGPDREARYGLDLGRCFRDFRFATATCRCA